MDTTEVHALFFTRQICVQLLLKPRRSREVQPEEEQEEDNKLELQKNKNRT
jgi:hypothetical protein